MFTALENRLEGKTTSRVERLFRTVNMRVNRNCALGSIIGRIASPESELSTWHWLQQRSAVGELLDVDFEAVPLMRLYRVSDLLVRQRDKIEKQLFERINDLLWQN
jgi:hypothetical protein